ncbi:T9SS type A sorting domain-containing protein [Joostella atrarenae]|uniref:T9SS type A sorting domain-containing protein n=1 Tax=Joostella atrarenae TaxID=679257 RepID=A0ABS9J2B3_9FLAO|nr:T9SS type A sorting domain-containing protein [Joostella atrarenae]MCF8714571.1 T9SS type A sorting domain-containing protein [Joostella atrarenae]
MRITLILCFFMQLVFPLMANKVEMIVPHTKSLTTNPLTNPNDSQWSLESMLAFYNDEKSVQDDSLKVYPNPVNKKDMLNINMAGNGVKRLTFYDITGTMVKTLETERTTFTFSISDMDTGVYFLNVSASSFQTTKKVIVK